MTAYCIDIADADDDVDGIGSATRLCRYGARGGSHSWLTGIESWRVRWSHPGRCSGKMPPLFAAAAVADDTDRLQITVGPSFGNQSDRRTD